MSTSRKHVLSTTVNGEPCEVLVEPFCSLLDMLRDSLQLTGTKKGCDEGDCGACTVIMDNKTVTSCMMLALDAQDQSITTVEGLMQDGQLHPVQAAFVEHGGCSAAFVHRG
jgi:aerobic-type carbon monoxide dehydrogenase small subunit (CoxS/CutS family)